MEAIYSSTALQTNQREIKDVARRQIVHITENGNGAFVFCSEELFQQELDAVRAEAAEEARLSFYIERGRSDVRSGRVYRGTEAARAAIEAAAAHHG